MKIETAKLQNFLTKARMAEVNTCLLQFNEDGLYITALSPGNTHMCVCTLYKSNFTDYAPIGNVGVDDLHRLINVLKKLDKEIELKVEGNLMYMDGAKKSVHFELVDEKFIDEVKPMPAMEHSTKFTIKASKFNDFLNDAQTNKDAVVFIETVDGGVKLSNDGKYQFNYNIDSEGTEAGVKLKFGSPIISTLSEIKTGDLICNVKSAYPIIIEHTTEEYKMSFLVAPREDN